MLRGLIPTSLREELILASNYAWGSSEIIQSICQVQKEFYGSGFSLQLKTKNTSYKESLQDRVNEMIRLHEIRKVVDELILDFVSTDNFILHWAVNGKDLKYVTSINPARCDYIRSPGVDTLRVEMDDATITRIKVAIASKNLPEVQKLYPQKYIDAVQKGLRMIELRNEDGEYWVVKTSARRFSGLAHPSMKGIFSDIILRETLIAGDWAVAYYLKRVIEHVKAGESPPHGQLQNLRALYPTKEQIGEYLKAFKNVGQTLRFFTDHTVEINYPHPPVEIFDPSKYEKCEERILRWGGVVDVMMTGKGEGFAQGHLGVKRFVAKGLRARAVIAEAMEEFLLHESISPILKVPSGSTVETRFNEQTLKDPKQVLDELNAAMDHGVLDVESYHEGLGLCYELVKSRKERDMKEKETWQPLFEKSQGMLSGKNGRPEEGEPQPAPSQRPKPSNKGQK